MSAPFRWGLLGAGEVAGNFGASARLLPGHEIAAVASRRGRRLIRRGRRLIWRGRSISTTTTQLVTKALKRSEGMP